MTLDRWIAACFLVSALIYAYAAFDYPLLPFERNMVFLPNTWPKVLSIIAIILSMLILVAPKAPAPESGGVDGIDLTRLGDYKIGSAFGLIAAMVLYALALRPVGFLAATIVFLVGAGWILGERKPVRMVLISAVAAGVIWYLVQETLGIFLRPFPAFIA